MENNPTIDEIENATFENDDFSEVPPSDIVSYNELRSCADLYRMYDRGILDIHPDFQRDFVWKDVDQTRFIDSLIKQLPIPSMCFALDFKTQRWQVIDGLQRMSTIVRFLSGGDWKLSKLDDIEQSISGKSVFSIKMTEPKLRRYFDMVENLSIPITVIRCEFNKTAHMEYLFTIFHRLNTGGMKLNNQEIRNCIYNGSFNSLLARLDLHPNWRKLNKMKGNSTDRFRKQEIILRLFAFGEKYKTYGGRLAKFLNTYMHEKRNEEKEFLDEKELLFKRTVDVIFIKIFGNRPPSKISITILESLLVGVSINVTKCEAFSAEELQSRYSRLIESDDFSEELLREGLSGKQRVIDRIDSSIRTFS